MKNLYTPVQVLESSCSGQRELITPGQTLDTYSTLGKKIDGQISTLFHQGLNIICPGTNFFLRFESSELFIAKRSISAFSQELIATTTVNIMMKYQGIIFLGFFI
jgi:hypothetical protein